MARTGRFVWYELLTNDPAGAPAFYGPVAGFRTDRWEAADYTMWVAQGGPVGGVMQLPEQAKAMGAPSHWLGYVSVVDVEDTAARVEALGGRVLVPPTAVPNGGKFAVFADPDGVPFGVHGGGGDGQPDRELTLGDFEWCELGSTDPDRAFAFYTELFGWVKTGAMDMGPGMGSYQMFGQPGQRDIGGMMRLPPGAPGPFWVYYATVADADQAFATAQSLGGGVAYPPMDIPGGGRAALVVDPQGAVFGFVSHPKGS